VGTGNGLARALSIPLELEEAVKLAAAPQRQQAIDVMQVLDGYYVLNASAGISSRAMRRVSHEEKRRFGVLAYFWAILVEFFSRRMPLFRLEIDGHALEVRAVEVLVSNGELLTKPPEILGPRRTFSSGQLEVHILTARSLVEYLRLVWNWLLHGKRRQERLRQLVVKQRIRLDSAGGPQPVQADGELIGQTPATVTLLPSAVQVIVPDRAEDE
jgi:diacylglycerol kinase family enzyme